MIRPSRARLARWALAALLAIGAVAGCTALERSLVYPATRYTTGEFAHRVAEQFGGRASILAPFDALVVEPAATASAPARTPTAIYFHGNGDVNTNLASLASVFTQRGMRLVVPEYPGYGARSGTPSERVLVDDAKALYASLAERYRGAPFIVIGQSLGSGVAAQVAADATAPPARLVLITPFLNLPDAASHSLGGWPVQSIISDRYDSAAALARYGGPVALLVAGNDRLIGPEQGRQLARVPRPAGTTTLLELPDADHDNWPAAMTPSRWDALLLGEAVPR